MSLSMFPCAKHPWKNRSEKNQEKVEGMLKRVHFSKYLLWGQYVPGRR